jgi:outer membrane protein assembly factor BamD
LRTRGSTGARRGDRGAACVLLLSLAALGWLAPGCAAGRKSKKAEPLQPPLQVYQMAMAKMEKKRYYAARTLLQGVLPRVPPDDRDLLPKIQLAIADSFFKERGQLNYGEALNSYRTFLTYYPNHEAADRAQFMVGMSLFQQALSPDRDQALTYQAISEFKKVEAVYPTSPFIAQASQKLVECNDRLAEHERLVGRFYQKRKRYNAAIDRYRTILDKYPHYSRSDQVLFDLGSCLLRVGNRPEAEEFFSRLFQDRPAGKETEKARKLLAEFDQKRGKPARKDRKK